MKTLVSLVTFVTVAGSAAFADGKLAPLPDNGFVTEAHKTHVGQVVFAKQAAAVTTPEAPAQFTTKLALADEIWLRAYLPHSLQNAFRAQGVECVRDDAFRVWDITVDGKVLGEDGHLFMEPARETAAIYNKSTSIRFDKPLNAKASVDERSLWRQFGDVVAPSLTTGTHTITLSVTGMCTANADGYPRVTLAVPMATGTFELTVTDKALTASAALGTKLPPPAMKNAKLEKEMLSIMKRKWNEDEIFRLVIVDKDWTVRRFPETNVPRERVLGTMLTGKQKDGKCRLFPVTFVQASEDGLRKWGKTEYNSVGDAAELPCDKAKQ